VDAEGRICEADEVSIGSSLGVRVAHARQSTAAKVAHEGEIMAKTPKPAAPDNSGKKPWPKPGSGTKPGKKPKPKK
jgi:hypothetical protein